MTSSRYDVINDVTNPIITSLLTCARSLMKFPAIFREIGFQLVAVAYISRNRVTLSPPKHSYVLITFRLS